MSDDIDWKARAEKLEAWFRKHGRHASLCGAGNSWPWRETDRAICNCGLVDALSAPAPRCEHCHCPPHAGRCVVVKEDVRITGKPYEYTCGCVAASAQPESVPHAEFVRNPIAVSAIAQERGSVVLTDDVGKECARLAYVPAAGASTTSEITARPYSFDGLSAPAPAPAAAEGDALAEAIRRVNLLVEMPGSIQPKTAERIAGFLEEASSQMTALRSVLIELACDGDGHGRSMLDLCEEIRRDIQSGEEELAARTSERDAAIANAADADTLRALDALHASHGIRPRYTCWTEGHQGGAFVHTKLLGADADGQVKPKGELGPWRKTSAGAFADALEIAQKLMARIDEARAALEPKTEPK